MEKFKGNLYKPNTNIEPPNLDGFLYELIKKISNDLVDKLDDYLIEGLKRKGFEFEDRGELEKFIKNRCKCIDLVDFKYCVYYVDDMPFFIHYYDKNIFSTGINDNRNILTADYGHYAYV